METLDIRADIDLSVTSVYDFVMSDILVLALVLVMCVLLMAYKYDSAYRIKDSTDVAYENYIHKIGGKITEDTQKFIEEEWEYLFNVEDATFYGGCFEALAMVEV